MDCKHERIISRNCRIFCQICGQELPLEVLTKKNTPEAEKPQETPQKAGKRTTRK